MTWKCFPAHDSIHMRQHTMALCGNYQRARDLTLKRDEVTCPDCLAELTRLEADTRTAAEVFGTVDELRAVGPTVPHQEFNPTQGYRPKESR